MLEKIIFYLLSLIVAFFIGFYWDRVTQKRNKRKNDRDALLRTLYILQDLMLPVDTGESERSPFKNYDELGRLGLVIKLKENEDLADEIPKFARENRGKNVIPNHGLRKSINSLKEKIEERLKKEGK